MTLESNPDYVPLEDYDDRMIDSVPIYAALYRTAGRSDQDWQDRLHDTIVWLLEHSGQMPDEDGNLQPIREPIGLAVAHMRGRIRNSRKRPEVRHPHESLEAKRPDGLTVAEKLAAKDRADARAIIRQALKRLAPVQRVVVRLTLSGYTQPDIARRLKASQPTIHRLAKRAMASLAQ